MLQGSVRSAFRLAALRGASHVWSAAPVFKSAHPRYFSAIPEDGRPWYTLGVSISNQMGELRQDVRQGEELDCFVKGLTDVFMGKVDQEAVSKELAEKVSKILLERKQEREAPLIAETKAKAAAVEKKLLEAAGQKDGAVKLPSGVVVVHTKVGSGEQPGLKSTIKVHYRGSLPNGNVFDDSFKRGEPAEFKLKHTIPGFAEGLSHVKVGGTASIVVPYELAYGDSPQANGLIPACSTLTFEVELIEIIPKDVLKARREAAKAAAKAAGMPMEFDEDEDDE